MSLVSIFGFVSFFSVSIFVLFSEFFFFALLSLQFIFVMFTFSPTQQNEKYKEVRKFKKLKNYVQENFTTKSFNLS